MPDVLPLDPDPPEISDEDWAALAQEMAATLLLTVLAAYTAGAATPLVLLRAAKLASRARGAYQAAARFIRTIKDPKTREALEKRQEALEKAIKRVDEAVKRSEAKVSAEKIARGHGFENHIVRQSKRYPDIKNQEEYRQLIEKIIREEKETKNLEKGRTAYWDEESGFFVVENPNDPDGGTAFRPSSGKAYFGRQQ